MSAPTHWAGRLAAVLEDAEPRLRRLSEQLAADRPDRTGREWADRVAAVRRQLASAAAEAAETARRRAPEVDPGLPLFIPPARGRGPRLGGTDGRRPDDGVGMRLAELPPAP